MPSTIDFDTLAQPHWSDSERSSAALALRFVQLLMNDHDFTAVSEEFGAGQYTQHNRSMHDGIAGVIEAVERIVKRFPGYSYDVKSIIASGDRVVFQSHATMRESHRGNDRKGFNIFDTWKVEDGALVEHWDSLEPIDLPMRLYFALTGGRVRNSNGVF